MKDYLGAFFESPKDGKWYGVKGMKWYQRRSPAELAKSRGEAVPKKEADSSPAAPKKTGNIQDNVESSAARYYRLQEAAKAGQASQMTEQDLKFFNARTEALAKINKMNETQPSWLRETATKVVQQSAQRQMQGLSDALLDKYVGDPIKQALKGAAEVKAITAKPEISVKKSDSDEGPVASAKKVAATAAKKVVDSTTSTKTADTPDPAKMRFKDALDFYQKNPSVTPTPPEGYSPLAQRMFMQQLEDLRKN